MKTPHHMTLKLAASRGIEIDATGDSEYVFTANGAELTAHANAKDGLAQAIAILNDEGSEPEADEQDDGTDADFAEEAEAEAEETEEEPASRSVVPAPYRKKYAPHGDTNGDAVNVLFKDEFGTENDDGEWRLDLAKFKRFAQANDLWNDKYDSLNPGMIRMNVTNRYRARCRKDPKWEAKWPK